MVPANNFPAYHTRSKLGTYHIPSVENIHDLPSSIQFQMSRTGRDLKRQLAARKPGDTLRTQLFGEYITMPYEVAQHIVAVYNLEGGE